MLKLSKLEVFTTVAQEGSFSGAARRLHLSQPAVSRHILELEGSLGTRLFRRLQRGVSLTEAGHTLQRYTEQILRLVAEAEGALTNVEALTIGQVRVGATPGVSTYLLPGWARSFQQNHNNLMAALRTGTTNEVATELLAGVLDLCLVEGELADLPTTHLGSVVLQKIQLCVVVGKGHRWWTADVIRAHELEQEPFVTRQPGAKTRTWIDQTLAAQGVQPRIVAEFDNQEAIKEWVMDGVGVSILPTYAVQRERQAGLLHTVSLADLPLQRSLKLLWDLRRPFNAVTRAFILHLSRTYPVVAPLAQPKPVPEPC